MPGLIFKYISCYSLSLLATAKSVSSMNLNTSHVILYLSPPDPAPSYYINLNTSHVILYPRITALLLYLMQI